MPTRPPPPPASLSNGKKLERDRLKDRFFLATRGGGGGAAKLDALSASDLPNNRSLSLPPVHSPPSGLGLR